MDEYNENQMNENNNYTGDIPEAPEAPKAEEPQERNTNAPSGWTYSANTNQYVSWDGSSDSDNEQGNSFANNQTQNQNQNQNYQPPRKEYGTQYGYYGGEAHTNYYSANGNYQWDFNKYESADSNTAPAPKKSSGKGLRVFLGIIFSLIAVCVISVSSIGIYRLFSENSNPDFQEYFEPSPPAIDGEGYGPGNPEVNVPEIDLHDIPKEETFSTDGKLSATDIYKIVSPSVVGVVQYQYSKSLEPAGSGSGIILSDDGYIVTNAHVIDDAEAVKIVLYNEEEYEAKVIGYDTQTDIAVLKIDAHNLVEAEFGDSSQLEIGETVYALGNPGGLSLQSSFTDGMVSGLNRIISTESSYYMSVIQTSAAINPGNSGGALINEYGQVIGITSAKIITDNYEGIGFAIPSQNAKPIIEDIISKGYVSGRAKIGITGVTIDSVTAKYYSVPEGVQIVTIDPDSDLNGKEAAVGDIITAFNGKEVSNIEDLHLYLQNHNPGDEIELSLYRYSATRNNDLTFTVTIKLVEDHGGTK